MSFRSEKDKKLGHRRVDEEGVVTYKKVRSQNIMGSIQLGIRYAIEQSETAQRDLLCQDFWTVESKIFPSDGSDNTPFHAFPRFTFKIYAPVAFKYFRNVFKIKSEDFKSAFCDFPLRELSNPGASGSIFYITNDDEFIIKTVTRKEMRFLIELLPEYYMNIEQNSRRVIATMLPKFFGLYCYKHNAKNIRLVVMNNLFPTWIAITEKYDLKGSTYNRKASEAECQKMTPTYKDLDFAQIHPNGITVDADTYTALVKTLEQDTLVLNSFKIMDYSLLLGIHYIGKDDADVFSTEEVQATSTSGGGINDKKEILRKMVIKSVDSSPPPHLGYSAAGGIPGRSSKGEELLMFMGIIDILQSYKLVKKLEHGIKALFLDGDTISVHRPDFYAQRFLTFMTSKVFVKGSKLAIGYEPGLDRVDGGSMKKRDEERERKLLKRSSLRNSRRKANLEAKKSDESKKQDETKV